MPSAGVTGSTRRICPADPIWFFQDGGPSSSCMAVSGTDMTVRCSAGLRPAMSSGGRRSAAMSNATGACAGSCSPAAGGCWTSGTVRCGGRDVALPRLCWRHACRFWKVRPVMSIWVAIGRLSGEGQQMAEARPTTDRIFSSVLFDLCLFLCSHETKSGSDSRSHACP